MVSRNCNFINNSNSDFSTKVGKFSSSDHEFNYRLVKDESRSDVTNNCDCNRSEVGTLLECITTDGLRR